MILISRGLEFLLMLAFTAPAKIFHAAPVHNSTELGLEVLHICKGFYWFR